MCNNAKNLDNVIKCHLDSLQNWDFCDIKIFGSDGGEIAASKLLPF